MLKFNLILETVNLDDPIGHLFVADIEFKEANASKQQLLYNEVMPPIIEKQKINERTLRLLTFIFDKCTYQCTQKTYGNMFHKRFTPLYLEDLKFLITRFSWKVTKIYTRYAFEQARFK